MLLDFILDQAKAGRMVTMKQANERIVEIIRASGRKVLSDGGTVSRKTADAHAHAQYASFDAKRKVLRQLQGDRVFDDSED